MNADWKFDSTKVSIIDVNIAPREDNKKEPGDVANICSGCGRIVWMWFHGQGVRCRDCREKAQMVEGANGGETVHNKEEMKRRRIAAKKDFASKPGGPRYPIGPVKPFLGGGA